jgi:hypothetical protein
MRRKSALLARTSLNFAGIRKMGLAGTSVDTLPRSRRCQSGSVSHWGKWTAFAVGAIINEVGKGSLQKNARIGGLGNEVEGHRPQSRLLPRAPNRALHGPKVDEVDSERS